MIELVNFNQLIDDEETMSLLHNQARIELDAINDDHELSDEEMDVIWCAVIEKYEALGIYP